MGLLDRLRGGRGSSVPVRAEAPVVAVSLLGGQDDLEVVGELAYQAALWRLCGGTLGDRVRCDIVAVLVPEPTNPYDANAIAVQIDRQVVGYLPRATAQDYLPGLQGLMAACGGHIALRGVIVGGGYYNDGPGRLGVWLEHNPADFGVHLASSLRAASPLHPSGEGVMRTGFTRHGSLTLRMTPTTCHGSTTSRRQTGQLSRNSATCSLLTPTRLTAISSSLSWRRGCTDRVSCMSQRWTNTTRHAPITTQRWTASARPSWPSGGKIPLLDTYRQMAIRQQKKRDWEACKWWAERGLSLYGERAAREEAVEDLIKRHSHAIAKLEAATRPRRQTQPGSPSTVLLAATSREAGREWPSQLPNLKYSSASTAAAASSACASAAANRRSVPNAAPLRRPEGELASSATPASWLPSMKGSVKGMAPAL